MDNRHGQLGESSRCFQKLAISLPMAYQDIRQLNGRADGLLQGSLNLGKAVNDLLSFLICTRAVEYYDFTLLFFLLNDDSGGDGISYRDRSVKLKGLG